MAISSPVATAGDVNPIVLAVGGLEDELIEIDVSLNEIEPASCYLHIRMTLIVIPGGVGGEWQTDVGSLA